VTSRRPLVVLVLVILLAFPAHAYANAGTPLMWATMLHLAFGNALIGVLEGWLLKRFFKVSTANAIVVMVIANYFSALVGAFLLRGTVLESIHPDLNNAWKWFWIMVVAAYALTIVLELPFIFFLLRRSDHALRRSLVASVVVQTISYVVVFGWYWRASGTSLYTQMHIVVPAEMSLPDKVVVYFISAQDGDVYSAPLNSGRMERVMKLGSTHKNDRLVLRPQPFTRWDLVVRMESTNHWDPQFVPVITNLVAEIAPDWRSTNGNQTLEGTWFNFGAVPPLGAATNSDWEFFAGFWSIEGLHGKNERRRTNIHFSYETPFGEWMIRNAVLLPTDKVLFQLGEDQICAFDPESKKVALLWRGRGPMPVVK